MRHDWVQMGPRSGTHGMCLAGYQSRRLRSSGSDASFLALCHLLSRNLCTCVLVVGGW